MLVAICIPGIAYIYPIIILHVSSSVYDSLQYRCIVPCGNRAALQLVAFALLGIFNDTSWKAISRICYHGQVGISGTETYT